MCHSRTATPTEDTRSQPQRRWANIGIIECEDLCRRSTEMGALLRGQLESLHDLPIVGDVRGIALFQTIELVADRETNQSFTTEQTALLSAEIPARLRERGVLCRAMHRGAPLIQLSPPLIATADELANLARIVQDVLEAVIEPLRSIRSAPLSAD